MTAAQIDCFIATAKNMSFSKAANEIFLSQSAVSRHIITLEMEHSFLCVPESTYI